MLTNESVAHVATLEKACVVLAELRRCLCAEGLESISMPFGQDPIL